MSRIAKCNCEGCNAAGTVKMELNRRGGRAVYLCEFHAHHMESYGYENRFRLGVEKVSKNTFGCELETSYSSLKARAEIVANKYIPTSDCTVNCEYKSPIMKGLNSFSKQCETFEKLIEEGHLAIGDECGTHFHFGDANYINAETISYLSRFYHSLFVPLCREMQANRRATENLFGRWFTGYAAPIDENSFALNHSNFINLEHSYSIEFRLCKFRSAAQMMQVARFIKAAGNCIIDNFIKHFNDEDIDSSRYASITEYRKHKAEVTAKKLVKLYRKYAGIE